MNFIAAPVFITLWQQVPPLNFTCFVEFFTLNSPKYGNGKKMNQLKRYGNRAGQLKFQRTNPLFKA